MLGVVVVVQATMLHTQGWRIALGTLPEWLSAVGGIATVGALVVAWLVRSGHIEVTRARLSA